MTSYTELPAYVEKLFKAAVIAMNETADNIKLRMMEEGQPIRYPVQWDSERQRRAFFATNGFGHGIPYQRTNRYRLGWKTEQQPARVLLSNKHPAGAVGGMVTGSQWQSRIHRNRWNYLLKVAWEELGKIPARLSTHIKAVAV